MVWHPGRGGWPKPDYSEVKAARLQVDLTALRADAQALVDALPKCYERVLVDGGGAMRDCGKPATRAFQRGEGRWCDEHGERWIVGYKEPTMAPEYPRAAPLRALQARLAGRGST